MTSGDHLPELLPPATTYPRCYCRRRPRPDTAGHDAVDCCCPIVQVATLRDRCTKPLMRPAAAG